MSRRVQRAAMLAQARRRDRALPRYSGRDAELDAEAETRRAAALCPTQGYCGFCGASVDEPAGRLHAPDCAVSAERRRAS